MDNLKGKLRKQFHVQQHPKNKIKYLESNLTKEVKDLCNKNYKTFLKGN